MQSVKLTFTYDIFKLSIYTDTQLICTSNCQRYYSLLHAVCDVDPCPARPVYFLTLTALKYFC